MRTLGRYSARYVADFGERKRSSPRHCADGQVGQLQVFYDGKPLPRAKVEVVTEFGWTRELKTDEAGAFDVELPWKGAYAVPRLAGRQHAGHARTAPYDGMRFVATLTFKVAEGLVAPPRPPVVTPQR